MKAFEVFEKLVSMAIGYCMRYPSVRHVPDPYQGTPGELLSRLSEEDKKSLQDLTSSDVANVPEKEAASTAYWTPRVENQDGEALLKEEKIKFDKRMKK